MKYIFSLFALLALGATKLNAVEPTGRQHTAKPTAKPTPKPTAKKETSSQAMQNWLNSLHVYDYVSGVAHNGEDQNCGAMTLFGQNTSLEDLAVRIAKDEDLFYFFIDQTFMRASILLSNSQTSNSQSTKDFVTQCVTQIQALWDDYPNYKFNSSSFTQAKEEPKRPSERTLPFGLLTHFPVEYKAVEKITYYTDLLYKPSEMSEACQRFLEYITRVQDNVQNTTTDWITGYLQTVSKDFSNSQIGPALCLCSKNGSFKDLTNFNGLRGRESDSDWTKWEPLDASDTPYLMTLARMAKANILIWSLMDSVHDNTPYAKKPNDTNEPYFIDQESRLELKKVMDNIFNIDKNFNISDLKKSSALYFYPCTLAVFDRTIFAVLFDGHYRLMIPNQTSIKKIEESSEMSKMALFNVSTLPEALWSTIKKNTNGPENGPDAKKTIQALDDLRNNPEKLWYNDDQCFDNLSECGVWIILNEQGRDSYFWAPFDYTDFNFIFIDVKSLDLLSKFKGTFYKVDSYNNAYHDPQEKNQELWRPCDISNDQVMNNLVKSSKEKLSSGLRQWKQQQQQQLNQQQQQLNQQFQQLHQQQQQLNQQFQQLNQQQQLHTLKWNNDPFMQQKADFKKNTDCYNERLDTYNKGLDTYNKGLDTYKKKLDIFNKILGSWKDNVAKQNQQTNLAQTNHLYYSSQWGHSNYANAPLWIQSQNMPFASYNSQNPAMLDSWNYNVVTQNQQTNLAQTNHLYFSSQWYSKNTQTYSYGTQSQNMPFASYNSQKPWGN